MFKVGKVLVLSLLVVGLCSPLAMATTSRVQALAGASNYINDDSDIFRWYGTLPSYSKMVMAEVGDIDFTADGSYYQALGFTHDWGEDHWLGTWGVFLLRNSIEDGSFYLFNPLITTGSVTPRPSSRSRGVRIWARSPSASCSRGPTSWSRPRGSRASTTS